MGIIDDYYGGYDNLAMFTGEDGNVDYEGAYDAANGLDECYDDDAGYYYKEHVEEEDYEEEQQDNNEGEQDSTKPKSDEEAKK